MAAPTSDANVKIFLANSEPSTHGASRKCRHGALPAAIEGNAENICSSRAFLTLTLRGLCWSVLLNGSAAL